MAETEAALQGYIAGEPQLAIGGRADYELDFLVCLVTCLMAWYGWPGGSEVERFVLCGETPHVLFMTASFVPSERFPGRLGRIAVEVNQATSPAELSRFFKDVRRWLAEREGVPRRFRSCGGQAADLALHVAQYNDGRRWQEMMSIWNDDHPQAAFADSRAFARRARDAYETLSNEPLAYRGDGGKGARGMGSARSAYLRRRPCVPTTRRQAEAVVTLSAGVRPSAGSTGRRLTSSKAASGAPQGEERPAYRYFCSSYCRSHAEVNGSMIRPWLAHRTTENHGVDSSILSLATSFPLHNVIFRRAWSLS